MSFLQKIKKFKKIQKMRRAGWSSLLKEGSLVGGAEIINRVTRILTAIALARSMDIALFGLAATALTIYELIRVLTQTGLGTRIVVAKEKDIEQVSTTVYHLNWYVAVGLAVLQLIIAYPVGLYFGSVDLAWGLVVLSLVFLIYPFSMVHVYMAQRHKKWGIISAAIAGQAAIDNILTAVLALAGFGLWAVILPKILVAVIWVLFHRRFTKWAKTTEVLDHSHRKTILSFGLKVLGVEILNALRNHGDKLIIGAILGPKALGYYAFASNIGNGITVSLSSTLGAVILPHLRQGRDSGKLATTYWQTLTLMMVLMVPIVLLQAVFAYWYVPIIFGEKWAPAIPVLILLALASLARPVQVTTSQLLRANDTPGADLNLAFILTFSFFVGLLVGLHWGIVGAAMGILISLILSSFILISWAMRLKDSDDEHNNFAKNGAIFS